MNPTMDICNYTHSKLVQLWMYNKTRLLQKPHITAIEHHQAHIVIKQNIECKKRISIEKDYTPQHDQ